MAMAYYPTSEEDKPRLSTLLHIEILIWYLRNPDTKYIDDMQHGIMTDVAQHAHAQLMSWAMLSTSRTTTETEYSNGFGRYEIMDRGEEHLKRILRMPLSVGRVVWTEPEAKTEPAHVLAQ